MEKVNGTAIKRKIRIQVHVANDNRPTGWKELYNLGISSDQILEWAELQVERWNSDNPGHPRRLVRVREITAPGNYGPWIKPERS